MEIVLELPDKYKIDWSLLEFSRLEIGADLGMLSHRRSLLIKDVQTGGAVKAEINWKWGSGEAGEIALDLIRRIS